MADAEEKEKFEKTCEAIQWEHLSSDDNRKVCSTLSAVRKLHDAASVDSDLMDILIWYLSPKDLKRLEAEGIPGCTETN